MSRRFSPLVCAHGALILLSAAEFRILDRLLFRDSREYAFVLDNMSGIGAGTPAFVSFQQRLLGPTCFELLERVVHDRLTTLEVLTGLLLLAANLLVFELARRRAADLPRAFLWAAGLGFSHLLLTYRLEYPWDGLDVLLFLLFGHLARRGKPPWWLWALCFVGAVNHETALYIPLWYLLCACDGNRVRAERVQALRVALIAFAGMLVTIFVLRQALYVGKPAWATESAQDVTPVIGNPFHLAHNLRQLFFNNWGTDRTAISVGFLATLGVLLKRLPEPSSRIAALWTLGVLASIVCFGYVNETRLYLVPLAFWFGYARPPRYATPLSARPATASEGSLEEFIAL